jgi:hypothetical protein
MGELDSFFGLVENRMGRKSDEFQLLKQRGTLLARQSQQNFIVQRWSVF